MGFAGPCTSFWRARGIKNSSQSSFSSIFVATQCLGKITGVCPAFGALDTKIIFGSAVSWRMRQWPG